MFINADHQYFWNVSPCQGEILVHHERDVHSIKSQDVHATIVIDSAAITVTITTIIIIITATTSTTTKTMVIMVLLRSKSMKVKFERTLMANSN